MSGSCCQEKNDWEPMTHYLQTISQNERRNSRPASRRRNYERPASRHGSLTGQPYRNGTYFYRDCLSMNIILKRSLNFRTEWYDACGIRDEFCDVYMYVEFEWRSRCVFLEIKIAKPAAASRSSCSNPRPATISCMCQLMPGDDPARVALSAASEAKRRCSNKGLARGCDPFFYIHVPKLQSYVLRVYKKKRSHRVDHGTSQTRIYMVNGMGFCIFCSKVFDFIKNISRTSAVSSTNFRSIVVFASCVVGTCNILYR